MRIAKAVFSTAECQSGTETRRAFTWHSDTLCEWWKL